MRVRIFSSIRDFLQNACSLSVLAFLYSLSLINWKWLHSKLNSYKRLRHMPTIRPYNCNLSNTIDPSRSSPVFFKYIVSNYHLWGCQIWKLNSVNEDHFRYSIIDFYFQGWHIWNERARSWVIFILRHLRLQITNTPTSKIHWKL